MRCDRSRRLQIAVAAEIMAKLQRELQAAPPAVWTFWESKSGEILKILAVLKFFAGFENPLRVMTAGNGAIIRPGP